MRKRYQSMAGNKSLNAAIKAKKDEFYTQLPDIENELRHYKKHFRGKSVLCNCDDPYESNFFKYFAMNFNQLGLKKLTATCYNGSPIAGKELMLFPIDDESDRTAWEIEITEVADMNGDGATNLADVEYLIRNNKNVLTRLNGNGDFRSDECVALLKEADIVVTNPPFSLFREYVAQLMKYEKGFIIIGNKNAITCKEIFPYFITNKMWIGCTPMSKDLLFEIPNKYEETFLEEGKQGSKYRIVNGKLLGRSPSIWFTNLEHNKRNEEIDLYKHYTPEEYPTYDNYDAIDVSKVSDIPYDYDGIMGVPITFMQNYNPNQFEILGITDRGNEYGVKTKEYTKEDTPKWSDLNRRGAIWVNGELKSTFAKLLIRKREND